MNVHVRYFGSNLVRFSFGMYAIAIHPKIRRCDKSCWLPLHNSSGVFSQEFFGSRLTTYAAVRTASAQNLVGNLASNSIQRAFSTKVLFIHSATPSCSGLYGIVVWCSMLADLLYADIVLLTYSAPLSLLSTFYLFAFQLSNEIPWRFRTPSTFVACRTQRLSGCYHRWTIVASFLLLSENGFRACLPNTHTSHWGKSPTHDTTLTLPFERHNASTQTLPKRLCQSVTVSFFAAKLLPATVAAVVAVVSIRYIPFTFFAVANADPSPPLMTQPRLSNSSRKPFDTKVRLSTPCRNDNHAHNGPVCHTCNIFFFDDSHCAAVRVNCDAVRDAARAADRFCCD